MVRPSAGAPPNFRQGFSTGTCAAAAAKAAARVLMEGTCPATVEVFLPDGTMVEFPVLEPCLADGWGQARVRKDAGDDPDMTHGLVVVGEVTWAEEKPWARPEERAEAISFEAGEGVGRVTKPGLSLPPGEPAINPVPRAMILRAVREVTDRPVRVRIGIPGGEEIARRTFNPRLGIEGGLSIIGTSGLVRPYSVPAMKASLVCGLDVARAVGVRDVILVPGNIGERAARRHFAVADSQIVQVANFWGDLLDAAAGRGFSRVLLVGHPGKLAKLVDGEWDTHSAKAASAVALVQTLAGKDLPAGGFTTVEGVFQALPPARVRQVGDTLAEKVRQVVRQKLSAENDPAAVPEVAVFLANLAGDCLGCAGDLSPWMK